MASSELSSKKCSPSIKSWCHTGRRVTKCSFDWTIDNFTLYSEESAEYLDSPSFMASNSHWCLRLWHKGCGKESEGFLSLFLLLLSCIEDNVKAFFEFSIYNVKGEKEYIRHITEPHTFSKGTDFGFKKFIKREILFQDGKELLYNDVMKLHCEVSVLSDPLNVSGRCTSTRYNVPQCDLSDQFGFFLKNQKLSDVVLSVDDKEFYVHKAILAARSPVFFAMFEHEMCERKQNTVTITDIKHDVFQELLGFIYTGKTPNLEKMAYDLLAAADKYAVNRLKIMCEEVLSLKLSEENVLSILILADMHNAGMLKADAVSFLISHATTIVDSPEWETFANEQPNLVKDAFYALSKEHSTIQSLCNNLHCLKLDDKK